jgi:hypothetical protein
MKPNINFPYEPASLKVKNLKKEGKREMLFNLAAIGFIYVFALIGIITTLYTLAQLLFKP